VKTENKNTSYRRVVTAEVQGKSVIQSDELLQNYIVLLLRMGLLYEAALDRE